MKMQNIIQRRAMSLTFAAISIAIFSFFAVSTSGWAQEGPPEPASLPALNQSSLTLTLPLFHEGTLFLEQIAFPEKGAVATMQMPRQTIATNVYRLADVNLEGDYLYQTNDGKDNENPGRVATWLGGSNKKPTRVYVGAGYVKLSPDGVYIAATDKDGILRIIDRQGNERAVLEKANNAIFSPDGTKLAFFKTIPYTIGDAGGIVVIDLASGKTLATYDPDGAPYIPLAFEEDGNSLYFTANSLSALQAGDPSNENRVDVYVLSLTTNSQPRLVTTGISKLPYIQYGRAECFSKSHLLMLSAEDTMWLLNTQTGSLQVFTDTGDIRRIDSAHVLLRLKNNSVSNESWNLITIH
jgi:WD40 repeat protein